MATLAAGDLGARAAQGGDWVAEIADQVVAEARRRDPDAPPTLASGLSPSGPIHLGNLREIMIPHLVADEIRRRGLECRHILSWDDYDRFRRVPAGVPESFAEHVGRALTGVPDPCGEHESWAEHFKAPFRAALERLGVELTEISQTVMYRSGAYREQILQAMRHRREIDEVLRRYRTAAPTSADEADEDGGEGSGYYPYRPYCSVCRRDTTTVTSFDEETTELAYTCACGHAGSFRLSEASEGKLVWKVDWPMRWAYEHVTFEAAGVDHSSPGSSFDVGAELIRKVFGAEPPVYLRYSFVGTRGAAKMSGSAGAVPTPADALEVLEVPVLRWLYARRRPQQSITISFDEVGRTYDEWDALGRRVAGGTASPRDATARARSVATATAVLPRTPRPFPFGTLAAILDITACDEEQTLRIVRTLAGDDPVSSLDELRPRLDCARAWVSDHLPQERRTHVRPEPDGERLEALSDSERQAIALLLERLEEDWTLPGLTNLLYGIPKLQAGLELDSPPTAEVKVAQREFFVLLYQLLVGSDTGPRLPTLLLSLGPARIRRLLGHAD